MSQLILLETAIFSLGMIVLAWVSHRRFTQKMADTAAALLPTIGLLGSALGIALAAFDHAQLHPALLQPRWDLGVALLASVLGLTFALSIRARYAIWGIPAALAIDAGPTNRDLFVAMERQFSMLAQHADALAHLLRDLLGDSHASLSTKLDCMRSEHAQRLDILRESLASAASQRTDIASQTTAQLDDLQTALGELTRDETQNTEQVLAQSERLRSSFDAFAEQQASENHAAMNRALKVVIDDFNVSINAGFRENLARLEAAVATTITLQDKHRAYVTELMHHERRSADHMSRTTEAFHRLVEHSTGVAEFSEHIQHALERLGPRQDATASALSELAELISTFKLANDAASQRLTQLVSEVDQSMQRTGDQIRRQATEHNTKVQQQVAAFSRELSEALNKISGSQTQQIATLSSKIAADLGALAQQSKKLLELSKTTRA